MSIHIKIDTGMGRIGVMHDAISCKKNLMRDKNDDPSRILAEIVKLPNIRAEGIYTHFAKSDGADKKSTHEQLNRFQEIVNRLESMGLHIPIRHASNSGAVIDMPEANLDMVRPGIMLYGLAPSGELVNKQIELQPAMQIKARITQVKQVPAGFKVGYGHTYVTTRKTSIATIPVGYADGYDRLLSSRGVMLVAGHPAPVVGRICMDQAMINVGSIRDVKEGDEVVILGKQGDQEISAEMMAEQIETINYEIVASLMDRVPRVYSTSANC